MLRVGARERPAERGVERLGDVAAVAKRRLGHLGPLAQDALGLLQDVDRVGHEAVVRERDLGGVAVRELVQRA